MSLLFLPVRVYFAAMSFDFDVMTRGAEFFVQRSFPPHMHEGYIARLLRRSERDLRLAKLLMAAGVSPPSNYAALDL